MKKNIVNFSLRVLALTLLLGCHPKLRQDSIGDKASSRVTLLISMDGFRNDYLDSFDTPNLDQIAQHGLQAEALIPVFPTKTFPNHYSIVTGLYPEDHGIAANKMYDRETDSWFQIGAGSKATREAYWFEGEPIWVTAKKQGVKTATLFWPGSDATPDSLKPDYHFYYDNNFNHADRIAQVLDWLKMPENLRPKLITLYFESPDLEGHRFGPFSPETEKAVERMDAMMGELMRKIEASDMKGQVNIVITSDHGMAQLSPDSVIFIDDYIDLQDVMLVQTSPKADIIPAPGKDSMVYFQLKDAHPHLSVFRKGDEPDRWHYRKHRRITPLIAVADLGWTIMLRREFALKQKSLHGGAHGYDNRNPEMWAVFMASGPDFKAGQKMAAFENIEIYNLLCRLLRISPATNSGDSSLFIPYLK
ncbi:MAG: alkaline phosphatase family protein [Saprospiraceae bacterium]|nr:alkaline phosphatase family protein [Saprospiraceae bacterium]